MTTRRPLSKSELELWRRATADVRPLTDLQADKTAEPPREPKAAKTPRTPAIKTATRDTINERPRQTTALNHAGPIDIDRRSRARLKRGQIAIERKLDLHGRTQTEAHEALDRFLTMASATGLRCVLVVTGKGGPEGRGVLRRMVPRWLDEVGNRDKVLTYSPAQPRHGGDGALYVLLRRRRSGDRG